MYKDKLHNESLSEILKIRKEIENEDKIFYEELPQKYALLENLNIEQLKRLCTTQLGRLPSLEYFKDEKTRTELELPILKEDFIHFIIEELRLSDIKKYVSSI
ncbi:MAG: hypothetical protein ABI340_09030 [Nitrososphaera sp.]|jgi:hypothetical protein